MIAGPSGFLLSTGSAIKIMELKRRDYPQGNWKILRNLVAHEGIGMNPLPEEVGNVVGATVGTVVTWVMVVVGTVVTTVVPGVVGITDHPGTSRRETVVIAFVLTSKFACNSS